MKKSVLNKVAESGKASNVAVREIAKIMRKELDARVRKARMNQILDEFKGSVAVEIFQRAEIRNAKLGASNTVLVHI